MNEFERILAEQAERARREAAPRVGVIRPTVTTRPGDTVIPFQAQCSLCGKEHGPDSLSNCNDWLTEHLREKHKTEILDHVKVEPGTERWRNE